MQGFCEKYYPKGVEIFRKTGGLTLLLVSGISCIFAEN
jgi:hypothetical protein